jgi:hypothetical protein
MDDLNDETFTRLWKRGVKVDEIARLWGRSRQAALARARKLGLCQTHGSGRVPLPEALRPLYDGAIGARELANHFKCAVSELRAVAEFCGWPVIEDLEVAYARGENVALLFDRDAPPVPPMPPHPKFTPEIDARLWECRGHADRERLAAATGLGRNLLLTRWHQMRAAA